MAVDDDVRRLSELDAAFLSFSYQPYPPIQAGPVPFQPWFKGRLRQANNGSWFFRSISQDGTVVGFELGLINGGDSLWTSTEAPGTGINVQINYVVVPNQNVGAAGQQLTGCNLNVQIAQELPSLLE